MKQLNHSPAVAGICVDVHSPSYYQRPHGCQCLCYHWGTNCCEQPVLPPEAAVKYRKYPLPPPKAMSGSEALWQSGFVLTSVM